MPDIRAVNTSPYPCMDVGLFFGLLVARLFLEDYINMVHLR